MNSWSKRTRQLLLSSFQLLRVPPLTVCRSVSALFWVFLPLSFNFLSIFLQSAKPGELY